MSQRSHHQATHTSYTNVAVNLSIRVVSYVIVGGMDRCVLTRRAGARVKKMTGRPRRRFPTTAPETFLFRPYD